jgi:hypothetical protein
MTSPKLEWRPIDTAEKYRDNPVLLSDGNQVAAAVWEPWGKAGEGFWNFLDPEVDFKPTYWMPLPGPPTNQDRRDPA